MTLRMRADPDAFLPDLGARRAAARLGLPGDPAGLAAHAERWRPWRGYALCTCGPPSQETEMNDRDVTHAAGPFTAVVDDEGAVLASGWTADADDLLPLIHPCRCATASRRPRRTSAP